MANEPLMPFLPTDSSFGDHFEWNDGEERAAAYKALTEQGDCINFTCGVWNEIVYFLKYKLDALYTQDIFDDNLSDYFWNEYGLLSFEETLMGFNADGTEARYDPYNRFTAKKFNAVRNNIERISPEAMRKWPWEFDTAREGYTGRKDFVGYETDKQNPDKLFGWYILELVRKMNVALDIWMGTANISDLAYTAIIKAPARVALCAFPGLNFAKALSKTDIAAALFPAPAAPIVINKISRTLLSDGFCAVPTAPITIGDISRSGGFVSLRPTPTAALGAKKPSESLAEAILQPTPPKPLYVSEQSRSRAENILLPIPPMPMSTREKSKSTREAKLVWVPPKLLQVEQISESETSADIVYRKPSAAAAKEVSRTLSAASLMLRDYVFPYACEKSFSLYAAEPDRRLGKHFAASYVLKTKSSAEADVKAPVHFDYGEASKSAHSALFETRKAARLGNVISVSRTDMSAEMPVFPRVIMEHEAMIKSLCSAPFKRFHALRLTTAVMSKTEEAAEMRVFKGVILPDVGAVSTSLEAGQIGFAPPSRLGACPRSASVAQAETELKHSSRLAVKSASASKAFAALELEAPEIDWIYPIVSDKDVFIQQVYLAIQDEDGVHIE